MCINTAKDQSLYSDTDRFARAWHSGLGTFRSRTKRLRRQTGGFTLIEAVVAVAIVVIGFAGAFATVVQAGRMVSGSEEESLVMSGLEQRIDQLRLLNWTALTDGTGIVNDVWTARPEAVAGITVSQETITISPCNVAGTQTLQATWDGNLTPTTSFTGGTALSGAGAVKIVATLTWTGRRSGRVRTESLVTVISRGGISKSVLP